MAEEALIFTLAEKLVGKQVDRDAVLESLQFIREHYGFDCGAVYESDQYHWFHKMEESFSSDVHVPKSFQLEEISAEYCRSLIEEPGLCICSQSSSLPMERELCGLFGGVSLILYPVVDNTGHILGFLAFTNVKDQLQLDERSKHLLHTLLSMLVKYVGKRMYENKVSFAITSLRDILDNTGIDIYVNDFHTHEILYVNKSMAQPYGGVKAFDGKKCWEILFPGQGGPCEFCPQKKIVDETGEPTMVYTWDYQRAFDGSWFRVFSTAFRWIDGRLAHVVSSANITDNKNYEALIDHMANYDALTDLPNRRMLVKECEKRIDNASEDEKGYLLFFDIDGFKKINDNLGHQSGDEFLIELSKFFNSIPMLKDAVYRNGGDEFVAILGGAQVTKANVRILCGFIIERFKSPWKLEKGDVYCSTSIGIACFPEDGDKAEELLHKADLAMYKAKEEGGGKSCFGYELDE